MSSSSSSSMSPQRVVDVASLAVALLASGDWAALTQIASNPLRERAAFLDLHPSDPTVDRLSLHTFPPPTEDASSTTYLDRLRLFLQSHDPFTAPRDHKVRYRVWDSETTHAAVRVMKDQDGQHRDGCDAIVILLLQRHTWTYHELRAASWLREFAASDSGWHETLELATEDYQKRLVDMDVSNGTATGDDAGDAEYWRTYDNVVHVIDSGASSNHLTATAMSKDEDTNRDDGNDDDYWNSY